MTQELWIRIFTRQVQLSTLRPRLLLPRRPTIKVIILIKVIKISRKTTNPKESLVLMAGAGNVPVQVIDGQTTVRTI